MKAQILLISSVAIALMSSPVLAASRTISIDEIAITNGRLSIQVPAGDGVVIDLSEVGQIVEDAVFGDPTKFVITGVDGQLCYMQDKCEATGASVVTFRQVDGIEISTQTHSPDGSTTVTLITDGKLGHRVLHMRLIPAVRAPYTAIVVKEDSIPVLPVITGGRAKPVESVKADVLPRSRPLGLGMTQRSKANALAMGLSMANPRQNNNIKISPRSAEYKKVQNAIIVLRKGGTREEAAKASGLDLQFIDHLINLGQEKCSAPYNCGT